MPATPFERFASHVEWVREQGDAYDTRGALWPSRLGKVGLTAGGLGGLVATSAAELWTNGVEVGGAALVVGAAAWTVNRLREPARRETATRRLDLPTGQALNQRYELVRVPKKEGPADVYMFWHGPINDARIPSEEHKTIPEALKEIAAMAELCGIKGIAMSPALEGAANGGEPAPLNPPSVADWLKHKKRLHSSGRTEHDQVVEASPARWAAAAHNPTEEVLGTGVDALLVQLTCLDDRHPAVRLGSDYAAAPKMRNEKLQTSLKEGLQMQLSESSISGAEDRHSGSFQRHTRQSARAVIYGEDVEIIVDGRVVERVPIIQKLGLDEERLQLLIESQIRPYAANACRLWNLCCTARCTVGKQMWLRKDDWRGRSAMCRISLTSLCSTRRSLPLAARIQKARQSALRAGRNGARRWV